MEFKLSTPEQLNEKLKDDVYIKDFWNRVVFDGMTKPKAWSVTFGVDYPLEPTMQTKMYRWVKKDIVASIAKKINKGLEIDLLDNKMEILSRMHKIATDTLEDGKGNHIDVPLKIQAETGKSWLDAVKSDKSININMNDGQQINIIQVVQDKLNRITDGATIQPDYIEAQIENK